MMRQLLQNQTAIITGCNRGIGLAILKEFLKEGATCYCLVRSAEKMQQVLLENGLDADRCMIRECDFSDEKQVVECGKSILKEKRPLDILVNNVGISPKSEMFVLTKMDQVRETFQINFYSPAVLTQILMKGMMRNKKGKILFISSTAARDGGINFAYNTSKAAVEAMIRRLALEAGPFGIDVNGIAPGLTDTDLAAELDPLVKEYTQRTTVKGRLARPDEIAKTALYLCSNLSSYTTGTILTIDGCKLK